MRIEAVRKQERQIGLELLLEQVLLLGLELRQLLPCLLMVQHRQQELLARLLELLELPLVQALVPEWSPGLGLVLALVPDPAS